MNTRRLYPGLCIHWDHHPHPDLTPRYGSGTDAGQIRRYLRQVRPDVVQCHAIGTFGYASFPSRHATPVPGLVGDPLATWKRICDEEGVRFGCYVSTFGHGRAAAEGRYHVEDRAGHTLRNWVCPNKPYLDEFLLPFLREVIERYGIAQLWMDGPSIPWNQKDECVCAHCRELYREWMGAEMPMAPGEEEWEDVGRFQERVLDRMYERILTAVHGASPELAVAFNFAGFFPDGRTLHPDIDWLSADALNSAELHKAPLHATFLASRGRPADVMLYERAGMDTPAAHKHALRPMAQAKAETSTILAHGMRLAFWQDPEPDGSISPQKAPTAAELARFVRARHRWTVDNASMAEVAVMYNNACRISELTRRNSAIAAAHQMLQEAHLPCDIVLDHVLLEGLARYRTVILTEMNRIAPQVAQAIRLFVERGGCFLFAPNEALCQGAAWLDTILGRGAGLSVAAPDAGRVTHNGTEVALGRRRYALAGAWNCRIPYRESDASWMVAPRTYEHIVLPPVRPGEAWLAEAKMGRGKVLAITSEVFSDYAERHHPGLRDLLAAAVRAGLDNRPMVELMGHPGVEVVLNRRGADMYVHLVNLTPGTCCNHHETVYFDEVPVYRDLRVTIRPPKPPASIALMPAEAALEGESSADGAITVTVPELEHHVALRLTGAAKP